MAETLANNITKEAQVPHSFEIYLSDSPVDEGDVVSAVNEPFHIVIGKMANKIAYAKLLIEDGQVATQDFPISNEDQYAPGKFITIKMGDVNGMETAFKGMIVKHGIKIKKNRKLHLTIDCRDNAVAATTQTKNKYFAENTLDSDAFKELLGEYKNGKDQLIDVSGIEDTNVEHEGLVQYNTTDWDFIVKRANAAGQLVYTDNGILTTVTPTIAAKEDYTLLFGDEILEFEAEIDAKTQFNEVILNAWDSSKQEIGTEELGSLAGIDLDKPGDFSNEDLSALLNEDGLNINYPGHLVADDLKNFVKTELIKSKLARIRGRVSFVESTLINPRKTIMLEGVGNRFNGLAYITGVRYEFSNNIWTTDLQFGLSRDWCESSVKEVDRTMNRIPEMSGLHIATVTRLDDPSGEDRVKVRIPIIDPKSEGVWAKMSRTDAGEHRGMFFLPELDDEVLVGFLGCDPRYPMIVGMLNSSAKPAPVAALEKDNLKGYYSKEGSRLEFDDKNKTIKIQTLSNKEAKKLEDFRSGTPDLEKNNTIFIDDKKGTILIKDKNGNHIKFSDKEIHIFGKKRINIEAPDVFIKATKKLETDTGKSTLHAGGETKITGSPINLNP
ncbi:MAG: type VI secretion system tip protein VgrG [Crocinitomix sp.]|nr:type VI secretion system tip protein VgrG [Crocinitomix sp.]